MLEKIHSSSGDAFVSQSQLLQNNPEPHSNSLDGKFCKARSAAQPQSTSIPEPYQAEKISLANEFTQGVAIDRRTKLRNAIKKIAFLAPNTSKGEVGLIDHTRLEALDTGKHRIYSKLNVVHGDWKKNGQQQAGFFEWLDNNPEHQFPIFDPKKVIEQWEKNGKPGDAGPHVWARENLLESSAAIVEYQSVKEIEQTKFLSGKDINQFQAALKNGVWQRTDEQATLIDTMASPGKTNPAEYYPQHSVFVMQRDEKIFIHDYQRNKMHHPMTTGGVPVLASGIIKIENGVTTSFALISGHYPCGLPELEKVLKCMKHGGVNLASVSIAAPAVKDKQALQLLLAKYR